MQEVSAQGLADPLNHRVIAVEDGDFCEYGSWNLVFSDEFDDDSLNTDKWWRYYPYCDNQDQCMASRTHGWPDELQIFSDDNVILTGEGTVKLIAKKGPVRQWYSASSIYTSGMLHSRFKFGRGRFEIRCKVPKSTSSYLWPAFWLFGGNGACSEIDIMEILWTRSNQYHHALHRYNSTCNGNQASEGGTIGVTDLSEDFHIYRAEWDKWFVNFYVDDAILHRSCRMYDLLTRPVSSCQVPAGIYIQNQAFPAQDAEMSIIVDLALHKGLFATALGGPATIPDLPAEMEIDYIRVYQR
ncbi:MAG: glycoside hydrolase family 16 protein [Flavobacteriales bacterium]|nr:glycoside hydrolase family 16 protein [Flavobacteriales bacterium]